MQPLTIPRAIRSLAGFENLEYDDTTQVLGLRADLNRDGHPDYIIRSAQSLCGTGGCEYLIVDGATGRDLGTLFGGTVYVEPSPPGRFPLLHSLAHLGFESATWDEFVFRDGKYVEGPSRVFAGAQLDSVVESLKSVPSRAPPRRRRV